MRGGSRFKVAVLASAEALPLVLEDLGPGPALKRSASL